ncbi:efflux RND transporter periplasmic adaptor subunit [Exilibacterium tricleocarpae]|uniref:Efflux RND transporter periplasmic adaptor subunit n=1 Tax=Exilibacterium tricleocarpae TaxID=2591008 RepID=A0A545SZ24_9GAMM|nr:efflux RND transporter periplasmic adaptor subunit [Exilibacterium tricleocarpae]TQV70218.1 efflux RND transporter periplasmic adaptor subunit [Exilibacterium tricleocarpae]
MNVALTLFRSLGLVVLLPALLAACSEPPPVAAPVRPVKTVVITDSHSGEVRSYPGKIRAAERVDLAFQVPGRLIHLNVHNGQEIERDYIIAQLDGRDFESSLKAATATFQRAKLEYRRAQELVAKQLISQSEFDRQRAERDIAEAAAEQAQKAYDDTFLRAPFAGVVAKRYVENYGDVTAKQPIVSLQNNAQLEVVVNVPEITVQRYEKEEHRIEAVARFETLPGEKFELELKEFVTEADPQTQTFEIVMLLQPPEAFSVLPGMSVSVDVTLPAIDGATHFLLPAAAVFAEPTGGDGQFVWVIEEDTMTVNPVPVEVGSLRAGEIEILTGVALGMRVVTAGVHYLREGDKVRLLADRPEH